MGISMRRIIKRKSWIRVRNRTKERDLVIIRFRNRAKEVWLYNRMIALKTDKQIRGSKI